MPEKTEAQKKAQKKYMEKFMVAQIRMEREKYSRIQAHAKKLGQSVNTYINAAVDQTMQQDSVESPAKAPADIITPDTLEIAQRAADAAEETVPEFIHRAVEFQAKRDADGD